MPQPLLSQKTKFSLPDGLVYLNGAYMSPLMRSVEEAGIVGLQLKRDPSKIQTQHFFEESEQLREQFAKLIDAPLVQQIAIVPSVSYGMANVARNIQLKPHDEIILAGEQFPSNVYPWRRIARESGASIKTVPSPNTRQKGKQWNEDIHAAITVNTRLVAIGNVHWADGTLFHLQAVRQRTREVGALLVIDGTQSVGALPFSVRMFQPDALVCAGYKWLLGPYSLGLAYYGDVFNQGMPVEENWLNRRNADDFAALVNYEDEYLPGALRYEVGEHSNFILVPMLRNAIQQINEWQPEAIQAYCKTITHDALTRLQRHGYEIEAPDYRAHHLFGIGLPEGLSLLKVKQTLDERRIMVSVRGQVIRVSAHLYNTMEDLEALADTLVELASP